MGSDHRAQPAIGQTVSAFACRNFWYRPFPVQVTLVPDAIGVGTIEIGTRRFGLMRLPSSAPDGMNLDVVISFADIGALIAELDELRCREVARR